MAIDTTIRYAAIQDLWLGRANTRSDLRQEAILELMRDWTLDELAVSFLENGYWPQEAVIVVEEQLYGKRRLVVVEGNRRLAGLIYLRKAIDSRPVSRGWAQIAASKDAPSNLFENIPYIKASSRQDVEAYLGFRHVSGIKEWQPAEKAQYIAHLIEDSHMTYEEVRRKIGSKAPTVRQNYVSYRLLLQMEEQEDISIEEVEEKFSVLYLSVRSVGVQKYLQIDVQNFPETARRPVPESRLQQLANFALWMFGNSKQLPIIRDSRQVDEFSTILESPDAVEYLERTPKPDLESAYRLAGGDEPELVRLVKAATDNITWVLGRAHRYKDSDELRDAIETFGDDALQLLRVFPNSHQDFLQDGK